MKSFLIPSLLVVGFNNDPPVAIDSGNLSNDLNQGEHNFWNLMERKLPITLAGHSSHRSHSSHGSHRSSSTRTYPSTPSITPSSPTKPPNNSTAPESVLPKVSGNSAQFKRIAMRVQMYLYAFGFYNGPIDGLENIDTQVGIVKFQEKNGLKITGKIDDDLLKAMNVATE